MKHPVYPFPVTDPKLAETFSLEDSDDIENIAKHLIDGNHPGVLTTVDSIGRPHARWMSTLAFKDFPRIYTLTGPASRKIADIMVHPLVNWMFSNQDLTLILNLSGHAHVVSDMSEIKRVWASIEDKSHAYFLKNFGGSGGCAVLQTTVDKIECCIPQSNLSWSMNLDTLTTAKE
jgi:general stress protein 26